MKLPLIRWRRYSTNYNDKRPIFYMWDDNPFVQEPETSRVLKLLPVRFCDKLLGAVKFARILVCHLEWLTANKLLKYSQIYRTVVLATSLFDVQFSM